MSVHIVAIGSKTRTKQSAIKILYTYGSIPGLVLLSLAQRLLSTQRTREVHKVMFSRQPTRAAIVGKSSQTYLDRT